MNRQLALRVVLALVGILFLALAYPMFVFVRKEPALSMMFSLYVTLGIFLLLAIRDPSAHRSLIAFTAWSRHRPRRWMGTQAWLHMVARGELIGVAVPHPHRHRPGHTGSCQTRTPRRYVARSPKADACAGDCAALKPAKSEAAHQIVW